MFCHHLCQLRAVAIQRQLPTNELPYNCLRTPQDGETALHEAASNGRVDVVNVLLDRGADISATDKVRHP